jgi:hypothetical protein
MKGLNYLNRILTIIALCLCTISASLLGLIPSASAKEKTHYVSVPVNSDGSILVRFPKNETLDVNIDEVGGGRCSYGDLPINIDEVSGRSFIGAVPVQTQ